MASAADFRVLTPVEFEFVFENELKRAVRSQNFLTFAVVTPRCEGRDPTEITRHVARLISGEIRSTDILGATPVDRLSLVLLDADLQNATGIFERLMARLEHYQFGCQLEIEVALASCPTHGSDAATLRSAAARQSALLRPRSSSTGSDTSSM